MRARVPLLLLLGVLFLASLSVSFGIVHREHQESQEESEPRGQNNPFYFDSDRNQYGHLRVLQRFDQRSKQIQNLENYRVVEFKSKPNTLLLPHHADADFLLVVLNGRAILTLVNPDGRDSYILEQGHAQKIPAGTTFFLVNPDDNENLRIVKLAVPVNNPHRFQHRSPTILLARIQQEYSRGLFRCCASVKWESLCLFINFSTFAPDAGKVEKLINKQRDSHFTDAQPEQQQREEDRKGRKGPLSSILDTLY
ncbi:RmlC-like jelly roll fold [Vigna unguiculata]|uniref:RmlC-like jelly roll fold n=1 Tax=Vigna unguiculata TaxID=3917 RepID=A0A4D6N8P3_VIGUN|nr:RmlC-like jelly roll fold [Vigna unguiculata]